MDQNTELLLQKSARARNWEDEEKSTYDLETLREEFRNRLYGNNGESQRTERENGSSST